MRKKKRVLSFLTAAALFVSSLSGSYVSAGAETVQGEEVSAQAVESVVYLEEDFESYEAKEIIKSVGSDIPDKPAPVTLGKIIYAAGRRSNAAQINCNASIAGTDENKYLFIKEDSMATSERGISFTFDADIPELSTLLPGNNTENEAGIREISNGSGDNGSVSGGEGLLELSMDVKSDSAFTLTGFAPIPAIASEEGLAHLRAVIDLKNLKKYIIITNNAGDLTFQRIEEIGTETIKGATFYQGAMEVSIDNIKIERKASDVGTLVVTVKDKEGNPLTDASVAIASMEALKTDENGQAAFALPNGEYEVTVTKSGYEFTEGKDEATATVNVESNHQTSELTLSKKEYVKMPDVVEIKDGQDFIAAPKTGEEAAKTTAFTAYVADQYGLPMTDEEYTKEWTIFPAGTETADPNVTIDQNGVVSVSSDYYSDNKISKFDVTLYAFTDDRNQKVKKTLSVGTSDVIYYEPINWKQDGGLGNRGGSVNLASAVTLPTVASVMANVQFPKGTEGQVTLVLVSDGGNLAGIQLQAENSTIKAWTGWKGNSAFNQSGDVDQFENSGVLLTGYDKEVIPVTFVIDQENKSISVSSGTSTVALPFAVSAEKITGFKFGQYRNYGAVTVEDVMVSEPDNNYLAITGDADFAKVSGKTVTRTYALGQSVIVPDETFTWAVAGDNMTGITLENGKLSVADTAAPGTYTITAVSTVNPEKKAEFSVEIGDFQTFEAKNVLVSGPRAYSVGADANAVYKIASAKDSYGDDVAELLPAAVWSSDNEDVISITSNGVATAKAAGTANITAKIVNGTAESTVTVPVMVSQFFLTADAAGDTTTVDTSSLIKNDAIIGYQVTTAKNDGTLVSKKVETTAPTTVDTKGADKLEITPVFSYAIGDKAGKLGEEPGFDIHVPVGTYDFNVKNEKDRCDVYVNTQLIVNNILQDGSTPNNLDVHDIYVKEGIATIYTADYSGGKTSKDTNITITITKSPSIVTRKSKVYVLGDSLTCIYYNGGNAENNLKTGWGQVLQNYITDDVEVVDLGNSGVTAIGLLRTAFTQILASARPGDVVVLESGYNDRTYDTQPIMRNAVTTMVNQTKALGIDIVLVSPNASPHDYKADVSWTSVMKEVAEATYSDYIDLAKLSYDFLYETYGTEVELIKGTYTVSDDLHATYHGANKWASVVATELANLGYGDMVKENTYTFTDKKGNQIACTSKKTELSDTQKAEKETFDAYKTEKAQTAEAMKAADDSAAVTALIDQAKANILALRFKAGKTLAENQEMVDAIITKLAEDVKAQRELDAANPEIGFESYKNAQIAAAEKLAAAGDPEAVQSLINAAIDRIRELSYDADATLDENKDRVNAIVTQLNADIKAERDKVNAAAFEAYKAEKANEAGSLATPTDSAAVTALITAAKEAILALSYDANQSLDANKAIVDSKIADLKKAIETQKATEAGTGNDDQKNQADFNSYKAQKVTEVAALAAAGDSDAVKKLIDAAKVAVNALNYDAAKTLAQNKEAVDAIVTKVKADVAAQRAKDNADAKTPQKNESFPSKGATYKITATGKKAAVTMTKAPNVKKVVVPDTVTYKNVKFKVTAVAANACKTIKKSKIETLTIGKNVTTIGKKAFTKSTKLKIVTIGAAVTKIDNEAFSGCTKLKTITVKSTKVKTVGKNAFKNTAKSAKFTFPKKKFNDYKKKIFKNKGQNKKATYKKGK